MIAAGRGSLPLPVYLGFVVVGLLIAAGLVTMLVAALATIARDPRLSPRAKVGWILGCLLLPWVMPATWLLHRRQAGVTGPPPPRPRPGARRPC